MSIGFYFFESVVGMETLFPQREFHAIALGGGVKLDVEKRGTLIDS
ncbi:MAG: hypothetical protein KAR13_10330 [Desulfobulbaceae bacterium]|nr:hypothetical protein [Desulfobulbaceae bacterium]